MEQIVNGFVGSRNRDALEELRKHRLGLIADLNRVRSELNFDSSPALRDLAEDLAAIDAGFERLDAPAVQGER